MNCQEVQVLLLDHAEGCLERHQSEEIDQHINDCPPCRLALQQTRDLVGAMEHIRRREVSASRASRSRGLDQELTGWQSGSILGDFEILGELGRGGMGIVYRARQVSLNRLVALKVLPGVFRQNPSAVVRFKKEAQAAAKLHHTHIVPVYAQGEHDGHFYYAMELIDGESLDHILKRDPTRILENLSAASAHSAISQASTSSAGRRSGYRHLADLIAGVAEGLEHAHRQGVIHRDIKPQNLLMAADGQLHITDFGLARLLDEPNITVTGELVGTPAYMSPEQVTGNRSSIDHRTDVYSLGVTFYELLTGVRPFEGAGRDQVVARILTREPKPPRRINSHVPVDLETICLRALEKSPERRFATAAKMATDLRRFADNRPIEIRRAGWIERGVKWVRRHPAMTAIVSLVIVLATVTVVWRVQSQRARRQRADDLVAQAYAAMAYDDYREPRQAEAKLAEAASLGPNEWDYRRAMALASLHRSPKKAIEHLSWVVLQRPDDPDVLYLLAWAQRLQADRVDATVRETLSRADALGGPATAEGHFFKGQVLIREMDEAEKEFRAAVEMRPNYTQAILHLGRALNHWMYHNRLHDKFDEQKRRLVHACDSNERSAYPRYLLSIAYRLSAEIYEESGELVSSSDRFSEALRYAREAQTAEPDSARGYVAEAEFWESKRDYEKALALRDRSAPLCVKPEPQAELHQYRWRLHFWLGHYEAARTDLEAIAQMRDDSDPKRVWYRGLFPALILADQGRIEDASMLVRRVAEEQPQSFRAVTSAICALTMMGQFDQAQDIYLRGDSAVRFEPVGQAEDSVAFMRSAFRYCDWKNGVSVASSLKPSRATRQTTALPAWFLGAQCLGRGDRDAAVQFFKTCDSAYDSEDYCYMSRAFVRKMQLDAAWPRWAPKKQP